MNVTRIKSTLTVAVLCAVASHAAGQATSLTKSQRWFIRNGIQLQGMVSTTDSFSLGTYQAMNYSAINWIWDSDVSKLGAAPGSMNWARWVRPGSSPPATAEMPPVGAEGSYLSRLIALSLGDEPDLNDSTVRDTYVNWFNSVAPSYPNQLLYINNYGGQVTDGPLGDFISRAHPDMISFDTYPYRYTAPNVPTPVQPAGGSPTNWYGDLRRYRQHSIDQNTSLGIYRQTYHSTSEGVRDVSESELRLMTYAGLAFNAKYLSDFTYNTGASSFFNNAAGGDNNPSALYSHAAQLNQEVRNLGPAMVRLKPVTDTTIPDHTSSIMFVRGKNNPGSGAVYNPIPIGFVQDPSAQAYTDWTFNVNDPYLSGGFPNGATNLGTKNGGLPGDFIISWFTPEDEWFDGDDWSNEKYLMVVNGLADMTGSAADCRQSITLDFNAASATQVLQKLDPATGQVVDVSLPLVSGKRRLTLTLDGGSGVLLKFKDGAPFVGTLPNDAIWTTSASGTFSTGSNWDTGVGPSGNVFVHFGGTTAGSGPTYTVTLSNNVSVTGAFAHRDNVTLNLNAKTMMLTGVNGVDSLIVGMKPGETAQFSLSNGTLSVAANPGYYAEIGKASGAVGVMTLNSGATWNCSSDLLIGKLGIGTLRVNSGATANFASVYVGGSATVAGGTGSLNIFGGSVSISGLLKIWDTGAPAPLGTTVTMTAGSLAFGNIDTSSNPARFNWQGGNLTVTAASGLSIGGTIPSQTLSSSKNLTVIGNLTIAAGSQLAANGGSITAGSVTNAGFLSMTGLSASLSVSGNYTNTGTTYLAAVQNWAPTSIFNHNAGSVSMNSDPGSSSAFNLTMNASAPMAINSSAHFKALNINSATVTVGVNGSRVISSPSLSIGGTGKLDLTDNDAIIASTPISTVAGYVKSGYGTGSWNGSGIVSSTAALSSFHKTALGYATASQLGIGSFDGETVGASAVVVRYTAAGDSDLSGSVDLTDFTYLAANFNGTGKDWLAGDYNYDGSVDLTDFSYLASNFNVSIPAPVLGSAIPEPLLLPFVAVAGLLRRARCGRNQI
jgi:T5SS/PEP-CTERM-associated repeat protein